MHVVEQSGILSPWCQSFAGYPRMRNPVSTMRIWNWLSHYIKTTPFICKANRFTTGVYLIRVLALNGLNFQKKKNKELRFVCSRCVVGLVFQVPRSSFVVDIQYYCMALFNWYLVRTTYVVIYFCEYFCKIISSYFHLLQL